MSHPLHQRTHVSRSGARRRALLLGVFCAATGVFGQFPQQPGFPQPGTGQPGAAPSPSVEPPRPAVINGTVDVQSRLVTVHTARASQTKALAVANRIAAHLLLQLGYGEVDATKTSRTGSVQGLTNERRFEKRLPAGLRVIEVALSRTASGLLDVLVFGFADTPAGEQDNPDLQLLTPMLQPMVAGDPAELAGPASTAYSRMAYQLSYIQADQAMAMLKALGYTTVEFSKGAGDSPLEAVYEPIVKGEVRTPYVIKFLDAPKTSLMDPYTPNTTGSAGGMGMGMGMAAPMPQMGMGGGGFGGGGGRSNAVPELGGTFLHHMTSGEPAQRLLIVYDHDRPETIEQLLDVLQQQIDVPARQVVISALIVEINTDRAQDLGLTFRIDNNQSKARFEVNPANGDQLPFTFTFDRRAFITPTQFTATLSALIKSGDAEILSNPSVLVLDGRQARIQVGQQVPVISSNALQGGISQGSVDYVPVGIVLNLRPRITEDNAEVTMQVETIVSALGPVTVSEDASAPSIDNRQVQTFVRVADNTPFIIGGLISSDRQNQRSGIPMLSRLPVLGSLFRRTSEQKTKREVIVVLTPHIVPIEEKSFSYVIPKDSETFDSFGYQLFRNAYRIRNRDVFDLRFVYESEIFQSLLRNVRARAAGEPGMARTEPYASLLAGNVPGEEILVRRMMWEIIKKTGVAKDITNDRIIFFEPSKDDPDSTDFVLSFFKDKVGGATGGRALVLTFDATKRGTPEHPFVQPKALVSYEPVSKETYEKLLLSKNRKAPDGTPLEWSIVIADEYWGLTHPLEVLRNVLVLKRLLALNSSMPLTIQEFRVGRQIIFPTEQDITESFHVIDRDAARLFFEVMEYYKAFEMEFGRRTRSIAHEMR